MTWKLVVGGQGGVGKTTILHRFIHHEFLGDTKMTIGAQFHTCDITRQGMAVGLVMWDLGGQDRFRFILPTYVKGAVGCFICFDMSRFQTLVESMEWVEMFRECAPSSPIVLVGTKFDLLSERDRASIEKEANDFVKRNGCKAFIETSSMYGFNVDETIYYMVDLLIYDEMQRSR